MAFDVAAFKKKLDNQNSGGGRSSFWKPGLGPKGESTFHKVRVFHFSDAPSDILFATLSFYSFGDNWEVCPFQFDKHDPIKQFRDKLWASKSENDKALAKLLKITRREYLPITVRSENEDEFKIWAVNYTLKQTIESFLFNPMYGDITDVQNGFNLNVTCLKPKIVTEYKKMEINVSCSDTKTPAHSDPTKLFALEKSVPTLDSIKNIYTPKSGEDLEKMLEHWLATDPVSSEKKKEQSKESATDSSASQKSSDIQKQVKQMKDKKVAAEKKEEKAAADISKAFEDIEDELDSELEASVF